MKKVLIVSATLITPDAAMPALCFRPADAVAMPARLMIDDPALMDDGAQEGP